MLIIGMLISNRLIVRIGLYTKVLPKKDTDRREGKINTQRKQNYESNICYSDIQLN